MWQPTDHSRLVRSTSHSTWNVPGPLRPRFLQQTSIVRLLDIPSMNTMSHSLHRHRRRRPRHKHLQVFLHLSTLLVRLATRTFLIGEAHYELGRLSWAAIQMVAY